MFHERRMSVLAALVALVFSGAAAAGERIVEVRVHGNHSMPDAEVIELSGIEIGAPLADGSVAVIEQRLRASARFESVEVRKRHRSLEVMDDVALILFVKEKVKAKDKLMLAPVLRYEEDWGITFGGRATWIDLFGGDERISFPGTWGGVKRIALEVERDFAAAPITGLRGLVSYGRREHPFFEIDEDRVEVGVEAVRRRGPLGLRLGVGWSDIELGDVSDRSLKYTLEGSIDTRVEPDFPRNAVHATLAWSGLDVLDGGDFVNRLHADAHGYLGLPGKSVIMVRALWDGASDPLPDWERPWLGGPDTLRGHRAGSFLGDQRLATSLEWRRPFSSPLSWAKVGLHAFYDAGKVWDHGTSFDEPRFQHGVGAGFFLNATIFDARIEVGHDPVGDRTRFHVTAAFRF